MAEARVTSFFSAHFLTFHGRIFVQNNPGGIFGGTFCHPAHFVTRAPFVTQACFVALARFVTLATQARFIIQARFVPKARFVIRHQSEKRCQI